MILKGQRWRRGRVLGNNAGMMWEEMIRNKEVSREGRGDQVTCRGKRDRRKKNRYVLREENRNEVEKWKGWGGGVIMNKLRVRGRSTC